MGMQMLIKSHLRQNIETLVNGGTDQQRCLPEALGTDAIRLGIPWPLRSLSLVLTFLAGPVGFLIHLASRVVLRRAVATEDGP